jgi:hypothetical protein
VGSYASVLLIPQRKTSLCEALHGGGHGRSWSSINDGMVSLLGEMKEEEGGGEQQGAQLGRGGGEG